MFIISASLRSPGGAELAIMGLNEHKILGG